MTLEPYKDFYCFYIFINLQQAYRGSTEMLGFGVVGGSRPIATSVNHFIRYCHFIGNTGATSLEKILGRKLSLQLKNQIVIIISQWQPIAAPPHYDSFSDLLTKSDIVQLIMS